MGRNILAPGSYLTPIRSDNTAAVAASGITGAASGRGCYTLAAATYYVALDGVVDSPLESIHLQWDAALIGTITFEDSNFSENDAPLVSVVSGDWIQENPSTAYVGITGTGASASSLTITLAGGGIGGALVHLGNLGSARGRMKLVITTGGVLRVSPCAKE